MLRESSKLEGNKVDLRVINAQADIEGGVPAERALINFAEAAFNYDEQAIAASRKLLANEIGEEAMIDSAAVISNFQRMVRIADGTGIPLDTPVAMVTVGIREELGINEFGSAGNTPALGLFKRLLGAIIGPFLGFLLPKMSKPPKN